MMQITFTLYQVKALDVAAKKVIYHAPKNLRWYSKRKIKDHLALWNKTKGPFEVFTARPDSQIKTRINLHNYICDVNYKDLNHAQRIMIAVLHGREY